MKPTLFIIIAIILSLAGYSQNTTGVNQKPKGMVFVPKGSFTVQRDSSPITITISAYWMGNEITNKEFREFYDEIKNTPTDTICMIDLSKLNEGNNRGINEKIKATIIKSSHSEILSSLMDQSAWNSVPGKENYFIDPTYDNYPVVGVTCQGLI